MDDVQQLRYIVEMNQTAAFALFLGTMAIIPAFIGITSATTDDQDWDGEDYMFPPLVLLLANLTQAVFGITNILMGFYWLVFNKGSKVLSLINLVLTYLAWFPYTVMIANFTFMIVRYDKMFNANGVYPYIPADYGPSEKNIDVVGSLVILEFLCYASNLVGALTFIAQKFYRMFTPSGLTAYNVAYYNSRLYYYAFLTLLGGVAQLAVGVYLYDKFGPDLDFDPIGAGPYVYSYPEISIAMGCLITVHSIILFARASTSVEKRVSSCELFTFWTFFVFLAAAGVQVLGQVAITGAAPAATFVFQVLTLALFPTFLDIKACNTPDLENYYPENPGYKQV